MAVVTQQPDVILTPELAQAMQDEALVENNHLGWTVTFSEPGYQGKFIARPKGVKNALAYASILASDSLEGLHAMLPKRLFQVSRSEGDHPFVLECWF